MVFLLLWDWVSFTLDHSLMVSSRQMSPMFFLVIVTTLVSNYTLHSGNLIYKKNRKDDMSWPCHNPIDVIPRGMDSEKSNNYLIRLHGILNFIVIKTNHDCKCSIMKPLWHGSRLRCAHITVSLYGRECWIYILALGGWYIKACPKVVFYK